MRSRAQVPWVTILMIAANIFAAFSLLVNPDLALQLGFRASRPTFPAAFTSLFLHANVLHLLGNMVFLAAVGAAVELATGSVRFVVVYFGGGLVGVATHYLIVRHHLQAPPLIGASGCIAGCASYYSVRYPSLKVAIAPKLAISVAWVTGIWIVLQIFGAFIRIGDTSGTAFWAHIGGFAAGAILSFVFRAPDLQQVKISHEFLNEMNSRGPAAAEFAAKRHLESHPDDLKALWDLANAQESLGDSRAQAGTLVKIIETGTDSDRVEALKRICSLGRVTELSSLRRLQLAQQCHELAPSVERALLKSVVEGPTDDIQRPDAMIALAGIDMDSQPERAQAILKELVQLYPIHPAVDLARKRGWLT